MRADRKIWCWKRLSQKIRQYIGVTQKILILKKKTWCTVYFGVYKPWAFEALIVRTTPTFTVRICIWFRISTNVQTCICLDRSITLECTHLLCFPAICVQKYFGFLVFGFYDEWWHNLLWARYESPGHGRVPVYQQSNEREESRSNFAI